MKTTVTAYSTKFEVDYYASNGSPGSYWEPSEPPELVIESIYMSGHGIDVTDLLLEEVKEKIYSQLEKDLIAEAHQYEEDRAQAEYEAQQERDDYIQEMMRG